MIALIRRRFPVNWAKPRFLLALLLIVVPVNASLGSELSPRILFLASYSPSFHSFFKQINGLREGLRQNGITEKNYILDVEFLDAKRFPIGPREAQLHQQLSYKFGRLPPYSVIVTADDTALKFAKKWRLELFAGSPIVFLGVNNRAFALDQNSIPNIVGVVEERSVRDTLELATRLFPAADTMHIIEDDTPTGIINQRRMNAVLQKDSCLSLKVIRR